jgi:hypothetical protein
VWPIFGPLSAVEHELAGREYLWLWTTGALLLVACWGWKGSNPGVKAAILDFAGPGWWLAIAVVFVLTLVLGRC